MKPKYNCLKVIPVGLIIFFLMGTFISCKSHSCRCETPGQLTQTITKKGNKSDAKSECEEITAIVEEAGGHCTFYSE